MSATISPLERAFSPLGAAVVAAGGAIAGGIVYISFSGVLLGLICALAILGIVASILDAIGLFPEVAPAATFRSTSSTSSAAALVSKESYMAEIVSTQPAGAPIAAEKIEPTETEAQLLNSGRFAEYHLAKATRLFDAKNYKEAAYQAAASLAHGDLPAAKTIRQTALAALK